MQTSGDGLLPPPLKSAHGVVLYSSVAMVGVRAVSFLSRRTRFYFVAPAETLAFWEIMRYAAKQQLTRNMQPTSRIHDKLRVPSLEVAPTTCIASLYDRATVYTARARASSVERGDLQSECSIICTTRCV